MLTIIPITNYKIQLDVIKYYTNILFIFNFFLILLLGSAALVVVLLVRFSCFGFLGNIRSSLFVDKGFSFVVVGRDVFIVFILAL